MYAFVIFSIMSLFSFSFIHYDDWKHRTAIDLIPEGSSFFVLVDTPFTNDIDYPFFAYLTKKNISTIITPDFFDYVITTDVDPGKESWRYPMVKERFDIFEKKIDNYEIISKIMLPDKSHLVIFKKKH